MPGGSRVGVVIVVPAFTEAYQRDQRVISRVVTGGETSRAPEMRE